MQHTLLTHWQKAISRGSIRKLFCSDAHPLTPESIVHPQNTLRFMKFKINMQLIWQKMKKKTNVN